MAIGAKTSPFGLTKSFGGAPVNSAVALFHINLCTFAEISADYIPGRVHFFYVFFLVKIMQNHPVVTLCYGIYLHTFQI